MLRNTVKMTLKIIRRNKIVLLERKILQCAENNNKIKKINIWSDDS